MAAGCAALFALVVVGPTGGAGPPLDLQGLTGFVSLNDGWVAELTIRLTQLGNPPEVAAMTLVFAALALLRGRPRVAVTVVALVAATSVSSQLLKALLGHPRYAPVLGWAVGPEALPSGHATAAMSSTLAAVIAAPRRARLAAAVVGSCSRSAWAARWWRGAGTTRATSWPATCWRPAGRWRWWRRSTRRTPLPGRGALDRHRNRPCERPVATGGLALAAAGIACAGCCGRGGGAGRPGRRDLLRA